MRRVPRNANLGKMPIGFKARLGRNYTLLTNERGRLAASDGAFQLPLR